jgi:hypothetical protein
MIVERGIVKINHHKPVVISGDSGLLDDSNPRSLHLEKNKVLFIGARADVQFGDFDKKTIERGGFVFKASDKEMVDPVLLRVNMGALLPFFYETLTDTQLNNAHNLISSLPLSEQIRKVMLFHVQRRLEGKKGL